MLFLMLMFFVSIVSAIGRASRRRRQRQEEELALRRARERDVHGDDVSPFAGMPFGSLFEQMLQGPWTRSYEYDPRTGEWVDMSDVVPEPDPDRAAATPDEEREARACPACRWE